MHEQSLTENPADKTVLLFPKNLYLEFLLSKRHNLFQSGKLMESTKNIL